MGNNQNVPYGRFSQKEFPLSESSPAKPNLVYIFADDMGVGDVSCMNPECVWETPCLDTMAEEGLIGEDAHSSSAVCTPSRYALLTGRYNWRSILKSGVTSGYSKSILEKGRVTVASLLKKQGYKTACVGKWHLGLEWSLKEGAEGPGGRGEGVDFSGAIGNGPTAFGFDHYFGISASLDMSPYVYIQDDHVTALPDKEFPMTEGKKYMRNGPISPDFDAEEVLPKCTEKVESLIADYAESEDPFYIYFPLPAPHTPILPTEEFRGKSGANEYGDFCLQVDDVVGRVNKALKKNGLSENTIVIFTSDNGCSPMADYEELAEVGHNPSYVYRGHKADIYEGGHRVPFVMKWPSAIPAGSVCKETFCLSDLMATMAEITGASLPENAGEDSVSSLPLWTGEADGPVRESIVHHSINGSFSIRKGKWKLEMCAGSGGWSFPKPNSEEVKALPAVQLYDLEADIGEKTNLEAENPALVKEMREDLVKIIKLGRSTPGARQKNTGSPYWDKLTWLDPSELELT